MEGRDQGILEAPMSDVTYVPFKPYSEEILSLCGRNLHTNPRNCDQIEHRILQRQRGSDSNEINLELRKLAWASY